MGLQADLRIARIARRHGMRNSLRIVREARRHDEVPVSLAFAVVQQETSDGSNIFGHDGTSSIPNAWKGGKVTLSRYRTYRRRRAASGMQGVGPMQLTWWEFQDRADRIGGCWVPWCNIRVGLEVLAANIRQHGEAEGIARYNGSGPAAQNYSRLVRQKQDAWHRRFTT